MVNVTFADPDVSAALEAGFVRLEVHTDRHPAVADAFGVHAIPDVRILAPDGRQLAAFVGFRDAEEFLAILRDLPATD